MAMLLWRIFTRINNAASTVTGFELMTMHDCRCDTGERKLSSRVQTLHSGQNRVDM